MRLTPNELRAREDAIFDALEHQPGDPTFLNRLYRDGVPSPKQQYLAERVRVLFVFREPNMRGVPHAHDMRDEVRDEHFRPRGQDGTLGDRSEKCRWNAKAGMFAHAVAAVLDGEPATSAFDRFAQGGWNHTVVNRFGYIQIKKVGGGGTSDEEEIRTHAVKYAGTLKRQMELYRPHLALGCGVGKDSPARLLAAHVLSGGREAVASKTGATWWEFPATARPQAMLQLWHPAWRGKRWTLYEHVWHSVRDVASKVGLITPAAGPTSLAERGGPSGRPFTTGTVPMSLGVQLNWPLPHLYSPTLGGLLIVLSSFGNLSRVVLQ